MRREKEREPEEGDRGWKIDSLYETRKKNLWTDEDPWVMRNEDVEYKIEAKACKMARVN